MPTWPYILGMDTTSQTNYLKSLSSWDKKNMDCSTLTIVKLLKILVGWETGLM